MMPVWAMDTTACLIGTPYQTTGNNLAGGTFTIPTGSAAGDFLIGFMYSRDNTFNWSVSGWDATKNSANGTNGRIGIYYRKLTSGADTSPTWTRTVSSTNCTCCWGCFLVRHVAPGATDPFEAESGAPAAWSNTLTPDAAAATTTSDGALVIIITGANNDGVHAAPTSPGNYGELIDVASSAGTDASAAVFYRVRPSAGSEDPGTYTRSGNAAATDDGYHWVGVIKPEYFKPRITMQVN